MVVMVKLEGLNIVCRRGKWYVYIRETGAVLIKGFEGSRDDLTRRMQMPDVLDKYNKPRVAKTRTKWPEGTLGALIYWYRNDCAKFQGLSDATKKDYNAAFDYLKDEYDLDLGGLTTSDIFDYRDKTAIAKWPRFADKLVSALSSMFTQAVKQRKMLTSNPAIGVDKINKADKNANREWRPEEVDAAFEAAPANIKTILFIARYAGFRGQTIAALTWRNYQDDTSYGKCFRIKARKNDEVVWVPASIELQDYMAKLDKTSVNIATRAKGTPWENEVQMQTEVSHFLRGLETEGKIGAGTTLHGLRVTYAADLKRSGADTDDIAAALGDRSSRMGEHYTRHVENEAKVIRAFAGKKKRTPEQ